MAGPIDVRVPGQTPANGAAVTNVPTNVPTGAPGSVLERVREVANEQRGAQTFDLAVGCPPFGQLMLIRYGLLPIDQAERFSMLADKLSDVAVSIDMMVSACKTVLWSEHGVVTDLHVRLDGGLWEFMGWPLPSQTTYRDLTPREVVTKVFADNALGLGSHLQKMAEWMSNPEQARPAGGIAGRELLTQIGRAVAVGISARDLLWATPTEFDLLMEAAAHAADYHAQRDEALARRIINDLAEATK